MLARAAYGALFVVVLPAGLVLWAKAASPFVPLPIVYNPAAGLAVLAAGLLLVADAARELIVHGGGLPMNAFPPRWFVRSGIYGWVRDPIYIGFALACGGASVAAGSASGLWLVTPVVALASAALVIGYERHDLLQRFGPSARQRVALSIPPDTSAFATAADRAAVFLLVLFPWVVIFYAVQALGRPPDAFGTMLPFERDWPVVQWTEIGYASAYVFIPLTVLTARRQGTLRRFAIQGLLAMTIVSLVWLTVPVVATNRSFVATDAMGRLLAFEQAHSRGVAAFPAFHVLWALIAADAWSDNARWSARPLWTWSGWSWATLIAVCCITTSMHTVIEVGTAIALFPPIRQYESTWQATRRLTERVANSWREYRLGPVRVINHAVWAASAAGVGVMIAGAAAGPARLGAVDWIAICVLFGAGIWAQLLEGSSKLLRPFGWYGGIIGGVIGALGARLAGMAILPLLAAFALAAPWTQILGRVRCLVQGCCHGGVAPEGIGIRYRHPRSRVTQVSELAGVPVHATPLYSIAANIVIGVLLLRLRVIGTPDSMIVGLYLMLSAIARFVEESFRAEPQTPIVAGLRLYQWIAIGSLVAGIVCTTIASGTAPVAFTWPDAPLVWSACSMALVTGFGMGVDFPRSSRRFSRLASAD